MSKMYGICIFKKVHKKIIQLDWFKKTAAVTKTHDQYDKPQLTNIIISIPRQPVIYIMFNFKII